MPQLLGLHIDISENGGEKICYLLLPGPLKDSEKGWLEGFACRHSCYVAAISGIDWNNELTPWEAPGIKGGAKAESFGDGAENFLHKLCKGLMPQLEASLGLDKPERYLAGVSLSALFSLWASCRCELFDGIGCVSASLWYDGFSEWLLGENPQASNYYFSLGIKEKDGKNPRLASVEEHTLKALSFIRSKGRQAYFEYNDGNHFGPLLERMEKAMLFLLENTTKRRIFV